MSNLIFPCGCKFSITYESAKTDIYIDFGDQIPHINIDVYNDIPDSCPAVWEMLGKGLTRGCFQLESNLGKNWAEKIKPESLEELSDLISLIRPGCLKALWQPS